MICRSLLIAGLSVLVPVIAFAQSAGNTDFMGLPAGELTAGIKGGTLGIGGEIGYRPLSMFGARIDGEAFSFDDNFHAGRTDYHATANLQSYGALADLYPFGESFRVTGGLRLNENDVVGNAQTVTIGGVAVPASTFGSETGRITFDKLSPYVGFGWGGTITPGLNFTSDFGVMFHGNPKGSVTASPNATGAALLASSATSLAGFQASEQSSLQHAINGYDYYPVIELGLTYKF
jgi:hypothetical protein